MASRHLILVAGMHRSGTSALTRAINLAGVPLPNDLKGASPNNQDGFWELKRPPPEVRLIPPHWIVSPL
jgi:hypothetical protein